MNAPTLVGFFAVRMSTCCLHTVTHRCFDPRSNSHGLDQVCQREKMNISNERILGSELHGVQRLLAACKRITSKERANNLSENFSSHNWHVLTACRTKKRWDCFCYWFYTSFFLTNKFRLVKYKYDSKLDVSKIVTSEITKPSNILKRITDLIIPCLLNIQVRSLARIQMNFYKVNNFTFDIWSQILFWFKWAKHQNHWS